MKDLYLIIQAIVSIFLALAILLQVKGTGFGRVWGGLSTSSSKRGIESLVFKLTFVLAFLFILISILSIIV